VRASFLAALVAGLLAPLAAFAAVFVTVSLYGSVDYMLHVDQVPAEVINAQITAFGVRAGAFTPYLSWTLTALAAALVTRRAPDAFVARGALTAIGSMVGQVAIVIALEETVTRSGASVLGTVTLAVAGAGTAAGWTLGESARVLARIVTAIQRARDDDEIAAAIAATRGAGTRLAVRIAHGTVATTSAADPATLRVPIPSSSGEPALLEVGSERPWLDLKARAKMWRRVAAAVGTARDSLAALEEARRTALERERQRIGRDIHDTMAQDVLSAIVHLEAAQLAGIEPAPARAHVESALAAARDALSSARQIVWASQAPADVPLPDALSSLVANWRARGELDALLTCDGAARSVDREVTSALLRVAHEALSNVRKHAQAKQARVSLSFTAGAIALEIRDDGRGMPRGRSGDARGDGGGFGLASMREQVKSLGGDFAVGPGPGGGTAVAVVFPIAAREGGG
jgi:signal transduction histidine kinase